MRMASCFMYLELSSAEHLVGVGGAPWLAGRARGMTASPVTPSTHVCYLSGIIGGITRWTLSFPTSSPRLLMRPRAAPGWCRRQAGEGPCDPGKGFPVCFPALVGPGASGKWVPSTFCSRLSRVLIHIFRSLQGKVGASDTSLWCASALLQAHS